MTKTKMVVFPFLCLLLTLGLVSQGAWASSSNDNCVGYEYYELDPDDTHNLLNTDFDALNPVAEGITENFDILLRQRDEYYAFRFRTHIEIVTAGDYIFYTKSDDGSLLYVGESLVVNNDGWHSPMENSGVINLSPGRYPITVLYFQVGGQQVLEVYYAGPGISKQLIPDSVLYLNRPPIAVDDNATTNQDTPIIINVLDNDIERDIDDLKIVEVTQGDNGSVEAYVGYEYYEWDSGDISSLLTTDFDMLTPIAEGIAANFDISLRQRDDYFAFRFRARIDIVTAGDYTFYTRSDDGSLLYVGETLVVNNDGYHGPGEGKSGTINLSVGYHPITVMFFESGGGQVLEVYYEGPGISKQLIPDSALCFNNMITYTPNARFFGIDSFTYKVSDGLADSNLATVSVTVGNLPPEVMVEILSDAVEDLNLPDGTETSLIASLHTASKVLNDSNPQNDVAAVGALQAFINKIEAQRGKKISEADADTLIAGALYIIVVLGGVT
jgi:hypothetical protein